jgi:DNA-binding CsgD family transcriptional regulator
VQARERAGRLIEALRDGVDASGEALAIVDDGSVAFASSTAREHLRALGWTGGSKPPPALLQPGPTGRLWDPLLLHGADGAIVVRRLPSGAHESFAVVFERHRAHLSSVALRGLGLSPREAEVLRLLARGNDTRQICEQMGISPRTVHKHTERIHSKLGTHDRAQAIATALAADHDAGSTRVDGVEHTDRRVPIHRSVGGK